MPLLTLNVFGAPGHQRPNFHGLIYIPYTAPPYSACIGAIYPPVGSLVGFRLPCASPDNEQNLRIAGEICGPILTRLCTKVHEIGTV